ncbi:hypothetical protein SFRURICE_008765 [Spodoptera frugiperda]|uniref:SFRICE_035761 n=1 Tax=Spodoptera frugiperda TaxID=7108 RepID=A0A2H1W698_SPOFR|nr:hypothetical protein SFRURICE_008765 [Spodoptera frugiperda]
MVCEVGSAMDMSGEGAGSGASALQQRWYEGRVNGSPAAGDVNADANGDGFFHSPLEGGHHSRARYYHQQMHAPYSAAVGSHELSKLLPPTVGSSSIGRYRTSDDISPKLHN